RLLFSWRSATSALASALGPGVGHGEVLLPVRTITCLPGAADGVAVGAELAGETLRKVERREVRRTSHEGPDSIAKCHRIEPDDRSLPSPSLRSHRFGSLYWAG